MLVLREQILAGSLAPGLSLREGVLCEQLGVSRHTARVALSNLAHEGLVRLEANRGAFVRQLSADDIEDCYRLREVLEITAVEELVGRVDALAPARAALKRMMDPDVVASWSASRDADLEFHKELVGALGSSRILRTYETLLTELRLCFLLEGFQMKNHKHNAVEHKQILRTIEDGDSEKAVETLRTHLRKSCKEALEALRATV